MTPVAAGISEAAAAVRSCVHPQARQGVEHLRSVCAMPPGLETTSDACATGAQMAGSEAPKMTTTGSPKAAAMWAGPESLPTNRRGGGEQGLDFGERRAVAMRIGAERGEVVAGRADEDRLDARAAQVFRDRQESGGGPGFLGRGRDRVDTASGSGGLAAWRAD